MGAFVFEDPLGDKMKSERAIREAAMSDDELFALRQEDERREFEAMLSNNGVRAARAVFSVLSRVAKPVAFRIVDRMARKPRKFRPHPRETELLATGKRLTFQTSFGAIAAWEWGEGPTVHMIHGWQGRGSQLAEIVQPVVEMGARVLLWDGPAHGQSEGKIASAPEFAKAISEIAEIDGQPWAVVAHSMGTISSTLATYLGYSPKRRVYIGTAHVPLKPLRMLQKVFGFTPDIIERFQDSLVEQGGIGLDWAAVANGAVPPNMKDPLLLIHDRGDREADVETAVAFQPKWPGARMILTNGLGHNGILRDPEVIQHVVDFLKEGLENQN